MTTNSVSATGRRTNTGALRTLWTSFKTYTPTAVVIGLIALYYIQFSNVV